MLHLSRLTKQLFSFNLKNQRLLSLPKNLQYSSFLNFSTTSADDGQLSVSTNSTPTSVPSVPEVEVWTPPVENVEKKEPEYVAVFVPRDQDPKPQEPKAPSSEDCCMSGCRLCTYDLWDIKCEKYLKELEKWKAREKLRQDLESLEASAAAAEKSSA